MAHMAVNMTRVGYHETLENALDAAHRRLVKTGAEQGTQMVIYARWANGFAVLDRSIAEPMIEAENRRIEVMMKEQGLDSVDADAELDMTDLEKEVGIIVSAIV